MKRAAIILQITLLFLATGASAQEPYLPNPNGWGPDGVVIIDAYNLEYGEVLLDWNNTYPCNEALLIQKDFGELYWPGVKLRISEPVPTTDLRLRFAVNTPYPDIWWSIRVQTYESSGTQLIGDTIIYAPSLSNNAMDPPYEDFYLVDIIVSASPAPNGIVSITPGGSLATLASDFTISGLWVTDNANPFPLMCSLVLPTRTVTPTPYNTPTGTITGTIAATSTPVNTATPTVTPVPYVTWTPAPSPTPWQSPAPTLYPSPTSAGALPTLRPWPTVAWPTVETVTPFPTLAWVELTTTPAPSPTPYTPTLPYSRVITNVTDLADDVSMGQVYSSVLDLTSSISAPIRVVRGTVYTYMPGLRLLVDGLLLMLFLIAAIYGIKLILAAIGAIESLIRFILEFIPL